VTFSAAATRLSEDARQPMAAVAMVMDNIFRTLNDFIFDLLFSLSPIVGV
jgi:hypothetical protein